MPIVNPIDASSAPLLLRHLFEGDDPGPIVGTLAQVPELCEPALPFLGAVLGPSGVSLRQKEIAILRTSANLGCRFCTDGHTVVAADSGLTLAEVRALRECPTAQEVFEDPDEQALVVWIDAISTERGWVDPAVTDAALAAVGEAKLVELTMTIGATMMLARFASAFQLPQPDELYERLGGLGIDPMPEPPARPVVSDTGTLVTITRRTS
ncbi:MAG: carboxymuconolactone decarboxylase family protein [Actinomycetota bacterium]